MQMITTSIGDGLVDLQLSAACPQDVHKRPTVTNAAKRVTVQLRGGPTRSAQVGKPLIAVVEEPHGRSAYAALANRTDQDAFRVSRGGGGSRSLTEVAYLSTYSCPDSSIKEYMISSTMDRSTNRSPARPA